MGTEFTPIFLFILVAIMTAVGMLVASALLGPKRVTAVKQMPYESGMDPIGDARQRFDVRYYLVAIVFLLFDVELLFLYPWAVAQWSVPAPVTAAASPSPADGRHWHRRRPRRPWPAFPTSSATSSSSRSWCSSRSWRRRIAYAWRKGVFEWR